MTYPPNRPPAGFPYSPPPAPPAPPKRKWPYVVGAIFLFLILMASCNGNAARTTTSGSSGAISAVSPASPTIPSVAVVAPAPPTAPTVIKVKTMGDDFENNQIAGEQKWGGQYVQFTAKVGNIDGSGDVSFTDVTTKFSFTQVACDLTDTSQVAKLSKGKPATVRGIVNDNQFIGVIQLDDCELVS